ncbi:hypothetical protein FGE05_08430 [Pseudomonas sp. ICMP22404]|nr:hypothetical protein FGE05_08430 [Pseudomonas sp. ICMP22404]
MGASLLAIALAQLALMLNVSALSRAGSLPQGQTAKRRLPAPFCLLQVSIRPFQPWFRSRRSARRP